jgi:hypothetical protein
MWTEAVKRIKQALGQMRSSFLVFFPLRLSFRSVSVDQGCVRWVRVDLRGSGLGWICVGVGLRSVSVDLRSIWTRARDV